MAVWHCREKEIEYGSKVLLMGIVNVTPDSFSDGGDWLDPATALTHARALEAQGADILDIGGQSTRLSNVFLPGGDAGSFQAAADRF